MQSSARRVSVPLTFRFKLAWGTGQLATATTITIVSTQVLSYFTDHAALAPAVAGSILFMAKLYDVGSDFGVGILSDRIKSRFGRRRPWIASGAILLALSLLVIFRVDLAAPTMRVLFATLGIFLFYTAYSVFFVPFMAMAAEVSDDYHERTTLQAYGMIFGIAGSLVGSAIAPALILWFGSGTRAYREMALIVCLIPLIAGAICVVGTRTARGSALARSAPLSVGRWLSTLVANPPLIVLTIAKLTHLFGTASAASSMIYLCNHVLHVGQRGMIVNGIAGTVGGVLGVLASERGARGRRKNRMYAALMVGTGLALLGFAAVPAGSLLVLAVPSFLLGLFAFPALMIAQSMVADIVEWDYRRHGVSRAGAVSSLVSALQKSTPALSALFVGVVLAQGGYVATVDATEPRSAIGAIHAVVSYVPCACLMLAAVPMWFLYRSDYEAPGAS